MAGPSETPASDKRKSASFVLPGETSNPPTYDESPPGGDYLSAGFSSSSGRNQTPGIDGYPMTPGTSVYTPGGVLSRTASTSGLSELDDQEFPPLDRLTVFDVLEGLALPQHFERLQEQVRKQQQKLQRSSRQAKDKVVEEWRRRVPPPDEQLDKYRKRMKLNVERLTKRWNHARTVTVREKISFISGVLNIFISGYIMGAHPEWFHFWYTTQLLYYMPIRWYTYHKIGFHYFLADLCYFVNFLMILSIWFFPNSRRLFISTYCLAFGNNAVAIAMWRNSLVFHSLDKVTSLFIHIMPCATLHCLVHLISPELLQTRFPAIHRIRYSDPTSPDHYSLFDMIIWATVPYLVWQISYHFLITVRRREKIAAGRPTSFTWLRKSYARNSLGKLVLSMPEALQEPTFMAIQYAYALLTMVPCPLWFWSHTASSLFLMAVFTWATYNGATYYIDVFGKRMEKELETLKREVRAWQTSSGPEGRAGFDERKSPMLAALQGRDRGKDEFKLDGDAAGANSPAPSSVTRGGHSRNQSLDQISLLEQDEPARDEGSVVGAALVTGLDVDRESELKRR